jgi:hypothetical protein
VFGLQSNTGLFISARIRAKAIQLSMEALKNRNSRP